MALDELWCSRGLGSSSIVTRMSAIRKLAAEAADHGVIAPELAAGMACVKNVKSTGIRVRNRLSLATVKGLRDRAILAILLGCGLRRSEVAARSRSGTVSNVTAGGASLRADRVGRECIVDDVEVGLVARGRREESE
jgi:site-specific recombinase XerC